jgi:hypothetical protein
MCCQGSEPFWGRRAIVVRKSNEFSSGLGCTSIACRRRAGVRLPQELEHEHTVELGDNLVQRSGSSVVHHDHFKAVTRVIESSARVQADRQLRGSVVGRNHNRKKWRIAHLHDVSRPHRSDLRIFAQHVPTSNHRFFAQEIMSNTLHARPNGVPLFSRISSGMRGDSVRKERAAKPHLLPQERIQRFLRDNAPPGP